VVTDSRRVFFNLIALLDPQAYEEAGLRSTIRTL
jgi:hypothetical protein